MAKGETIDPRGSISRVAGEVILLLADPRQVRRVATITGLISGHTQREEVEALRRKYNAGLIKKAELIAYGEHGTRRQRKVANKLLKEGR